MVRPHASSYTSNSTRLPVLVWIFGGGLYAGSTADPQYNLSGIVALSSELNFPAIAVSFNYRLGMWGFLSTPTLLSESNTNAGLYDQRLAMRWIQDNIASFGGDADRVTIWGESAGAQSVSFHLTAYEGRWAPGEEGSSGKGLFQGAIMESGGTVGAQLQSLAYYAAPVENLTRAVGCPLVGSGVWTGDQMQCLRNVPSKVLWDARPLATFNPLVDGYVLTLLIYMFDSLAMLLMVTTATSFRTTHQHY